MLWRESLFRNKYSDRRDFKPSYMDKNSFAELSNGGFAFNTSQNDSQTGQMIYESLSVDMEQSLLINKNGNSQKSGVSNI